jgi:hypothetical protein
VTGHPHRDGGPAGGGFGVVCPDVTRPAEHVTPQMLMQRCDTPLLLAATRCAIDLAEIRGWSAATVTGVFYGLKAVLDGHTGEDLVLLSEVRERARPRRHSSATRIAEVLSELGLLHDDTTAAIRAWIDRRAGELSAGFGRDVRAWLVVLLDGDARTRPRSHATLRVYFGIVRSFIECWAATRPWTWRLRKVSTPRRQQPDPRADRRGAKQEPVRGIGLDAGVHSFLATSGPVMRASSGKVAAMMPSDTMIPPAVRR